jgi:hypothetical protein
MNATLQPNETPSDHPNHSLLQDWLVDSSGSSHVTDNLANLVLNVGESDAIVQVADGVLIQAKLCGTV